jgi:hypothetical protein
MRTQNCSNMPEWGCVGLQINRPQSQIVFAGRGGGIRTPDPLLPKQMRYQTALRPDSFLDCIVSGFCVEPQRTSTYCLMSQARSHKMTTTGMTKMAPSDAASRNKKIQSRRVWRRGSPRWRRISW